MKLFAYLRPKSILLAPTIFIFSKNICKIRSRVFCPEFANANSIRRPFRHLVEDMGLEPTTPAVQRRCSPNLS